MNIALHALDPRLCISALKGSECIYSPQHQSSWIPVAMVLNWRLTDKIAIRCLGPGYDKLTHKKPKGLKSQRGLYVYVYIRTYIYILWLYLYHKMRWKFTTITTWMDCSHTRSTLGRRSTNHQGADASELVLPMFGTKIHCSCNHHNVVPQL